MATQSYKPGQSPFIRDGLSADAVREEFIETPFAAAQQPAISTGLDLLNFMSALPNAFIASEQRELKRLLRTTDDKNDPRIERLKVSIERTSELHTTTMQGKARIDRALASLSTEDNVFHGFVSDADAKPMPKLTVRIFKDRTADGNQKAANSLSGTTDADGYFSILLDKGTAKRKSASTDEASVGLSQRMAELLNKDNQEKASANATAAAQDTKQVTVNVEILDANGKQLYLDPFELVLEHGSAYREYIVDNEVHDGGGDKSFKTATSTTVEVATKVTEKSKAATKPTPAPARKKAPRANKKPPPKKKK